MTLDVVERISLVLVERLQAITEANGYAFSVVDVARPNKHTTNTIPDHHAIWVIQGSTIDNPEQTHEGNPIALGKTTTWDIHIFIRPSDRDATPTATACNEASAAIRKAIVTPTTSPSTWYTFGGDAVHTEWGTESPMLSAEGEHAGITIPINITYRVSENDPTESRS